MATEKVQTPAPSLPIKKWSQRFYKMFKLNTKPVVKVYHGFGDHNKMEVYGHVLRISPFRQEKFTKRILHNTLSLLRLFMVKPFRNVPVRLEGAGITTTPDTDGFFKFTWEPQPGIQPGWHDVTVTLLHDKYPDTQGYGKIMIPEQVKLGLISDIDDTFLIAQSSNLRRRFYVLFTKNARTRKPFASVVKHYQLLAKSEDGFTRPFFYVSSSEWNLYDYIREFSDVNHMPLGIYLLNQIKEVQEFLKTGQNKHQGKYFRISRLLLSYPDRQFVLLGDDSQQDPVIYHAIVRDFPGRIVCVYIRHINKHNLDATHKYEAAIKELGTEICYYTHSDTAIQHSIHFGLVKVNNSE